MRKSHIVSAVVRAVMVKNVITKEGEPLPLAQSLLKTEAENGGEDNSVYLLWPTTVIHWIDEDSPFWKMSAEEMLTERFEIVVFLEGTIESTGMTTQVTTKLKYCPTNAGLHMILNQRIYSDHVPFEISKGKNRAGGFYGPVKM